MGIGSGSPSGGGGMGGGGFGGGGGGVAQAIQQAAQSFRQPAPQTNPYQQAQPIPRPQPTWQAQQPQQYQGQAQQYQGARPQQRPQGQGPYGGAQPQQRPPQGAPQGYQRQGLYGAQPGPLPQPMQPPQGGDWQAPVTQSAAPPMESWAPGTGKQDEGVPKGARMPFGPPQQGLNDGMTSGGNMYRGGGSGGAMMSGPQLMPWTGQNPVLQAQAPVNGANMYGRGQIDQEMERKRRYQLPGPPQPEQGDTLPVQPQPVQTMTS